MTTPRLHPLGRLSTLTKPTSTLTLAVALTLATAFLRGQDTATQPAPTFSFHFDAGQALVALREVDPGLTNDLASYTKGPGIQQARDAMRTYLTRAGVNLDSPDKLLTLNLRSGILIMRALDHQELATVKKLTADFKSTNPTQLTLETQFIEFDEALASELDLDWILTDAPNPDPSSGWKLGERRAILTEARSGAILAALKARPQVTLLNAPKITTLSGRQARVSVRDTYLQAPVSANPPVERSIDVYPNVVPELRTIDLIMVLGGFPRVLTPSGYSTLVTSELNLYDSQTAAVVQKLDQTWSVVFVSVYLIDPAGNRLNPPESIPFATNSIPDRPLPTTAQ